MLINLKEINNLFCKNIYNKFVNDIYGINSAFCKDKITENYLLSKITSLYESTIIKGIVEDVDIDSKKLQPINISYVTNNITNIGRTQHYKHTQTISSTIWVIFHNLGFNPVVTAYNSSGDEIEGTTEILAENASIKIIFNHPQTGIAECSP